MGKDIRKQVRLTPELDLFLTKMAASDNRSVSNLIFTILSGWMATRKSKKPAK